MRINKNIVLIFCLVIIACSLSLGAEGTAAARVLKKYKKIPAEVFAKLPAVERPKLSPDGTHVAGLFGVKGIQRIIILPVESGIGKTVSKAVPDGTEVQWVKWVNDNHIIVGLRGLNRIQGDQWYIKRMISIERETGKTKRLLWKFGGQNASDVLWVPSDGSNEILVAAQQTIYSNRAGFWPAVFQVNVATGKKRRIVRSKQNILSWGADRYGNVRYGLGYRDSSTDATFLYRKTQGKSFKEVHRVRLKNEEELTIPFMFLPGGDNALVIKDNEIGRSVIAEINLQTAAEVRTVHESKKGHIESVTLSADKSEILAYRTNNKKKPVVWVNSKMAKLQADLNDMAKNANVRIVSMDHRRNRFLVKIGTPDNPGLYYLYDASANSLQKFAAVNRAIGNRRLARVKYVQYKARDGLAIEAVLTLPRGREAKKLPFIVLPHGGPWNHDKLRYDYWTQFLANLGYGVLQPNFRGSTGYGAEFEKKGQGQMGFAMQDDVSDGVAWAADQGIADPKRVCIVGASYGGYAAMWGIVKDPSQYRCSISIAGVSSIKREVNEFGNAIHKKLFRGRWEKMTPDFKAVSPIYSVNEIKTPLLLVHGMKDVTVDHVQSSLMYKAMTKAGKQVQFISLPKADHYFTREEDRLALLKSMETFLRTHNPPD